MTSGVTKNLTSVWGRAASEVCAVGDAGVIRKFDGNNWTAMTSPTTANLASIWGDATTAVAVGANGTIIGLTGTPWSMQTSGTTEQLGGVFSRWQASISPSAQNGLIHAAAAAEPGPPQEPAPTLAPGVPPRQQPSDIWVSGADGPLTHFDGTNWSSSRQGLGPTSATSQRFPPEHLGHRRRWTDRAATTAPPGPKVDSSTTANLSGIWAVSPNRIYAVGDSHVPCAISGKTGPSVRIRRYQFTTRGV